VNIQLFSTWIWSESVWHLGETKVRETKVRETKVRVVFPCAFVALLTAGLGSGETCV